MTPVRPRRPRGGGGRRRAALSALVLGVTLTACGTRSAAPPAAAPPARSTPTTATVPPTTTTVPPTTTTDPGTLPQTPAEPGFGAPLQAQMQVLWSAIVTDSPAAGAPAFFPRSAYLQMKTGVLADPDSDFTDRLVAFYGLDISAYHQQLGPGAATATLVDVLATPADAAWIGPGLCENTIGYWHLPGVRLLYDAGTQQRSFAIASLISWRGVWYVVHLGPNPRPSDVGTVDSPAVGPGVAGPPGGC